MTRRSCLAAVMACVCLSATVAAGEQYYHYAPKSVSAEEKQTAGDGIVVQEIPVRKGDTLYDLSRKFSGKGFYYPQILLFNDIKDPNKIYTGDLIKIPLGQKALSTERSSDSLHKDSHQRKSTKAAQKKNRTPRQQTVSATAKGAEHALELSVKDLQRLGGASASKQTADKRISARHKNSSKPVAPTQTVLPPPAIGENSAVQEIKPEIVKSAAASSASQKTFERALKAFRNNDFSVALELFERFIAENPASPLAADANLYKAECYLKQSGL